MATFPGYRLSPAPPKVAFANFGVGTTPNFYLPAGVGELQYDALDPNNPGTITLQKNIAGTNYTVDILTTCQGDIPGVYGTLFFQTDGDWFNLLTTVAVRNLVIYHTDNVSA